MAVDLDQLEKIHAEIEKKTKARIHRGNEVEDVYRVPLRSPNLQYATEGGAPIGRFSAFWGDYCLAPDTPVLCADYSWVPIGDLAEGDVLVGFDEHAPSGSGNQRCFRESVIEANPMKRLSCRRLLIGEQEIVCSDSHQWLVKTGRSPVWKTSLELLEGDKVLAFAEPWSDACVPYGACYLAGLFDGEGWFDKKRVVLAQNPGPVLDYALRVLDELGFKTSQRAANGNSDCQAVHVLGSTPETMRFFHQIPSIRLRENAGDWWVGRQISPCGPNHEPGSRLAEVKLNEDVGEQEVCATQTSTRTLIAAGLMSHNSTFKSRTAYELIAQAQNLPAAAERALMPRIKYHESIGQVKRALRLKEELDYLTATWPDGMECQFYNAEQQYDKAWAHKLGIDTDRLFIVESTTIEDIVSAMEATLSLIEMHVIDSTSSAASIEEQGMEMTDRRMGLDARVWKQTLRKALDHFDPEKNIGILVHQVSTNIRTGGTNPVNTKFLGHTSSMSMSFRAGRFLYMQNGLLAEDKPSGADKQSLAGVKEPDGKEIFAKIEKSRVCRPFRIGVVHARYGAKQFDYIWELANAAEHFKLVHKAGSWYSEVDEDGEVGAKIGQGFKALYEFIKKDPEFQDRIYARLMYSIYEDDDELDKAEAEAAAAGDDDVDDEETAAA